MAEPIGRESDPEWAAAQGGRHSGAPVDLANIAERIGGVSVLSDSLIRSRNEFRDPLVRLLLESGDRDEVARVIVEANEDGLLQLRLLDELSRPPELEVVRGRARALADLSKRKWPTRETTPYLRDWLADCLEDGSFEMLEAADRRAAFDRIAQSSDRSLPGPARARGPQSRRILLRGGVSDPAPGWPAIRSMRSRILLSRPRPRAGGPDSRENRGLSHRGHGARGAKLFSVPGQDVRPATSRVRISLFEILKSRLDGAVAADLFAGTGSLGLEALSRGAAFCTFFDLDDRCVEVLRKNLEKLRFADRADVLRESAFRSPAVLTRPVDLVFVDPPYAFYDDRRAEIEKLLRDWAASPALAPGGLILVEHRPRQATSVPELAQVDEREYGGTVVTFYSSRHSPTV